MTIKYNVGDEVFYLSSKGFKKGIIKRIYFSDEIIELKSKKRITKLNYYLWDNSCTWEYGGDMITEDNIFKTYEEMLEYYSSIKL